MKNGKKPTYEQRKVIMGFRLDPAEWLVVKDTSLEMLLLHRHTNQTKTITKEVMT